MKAEQSNLPKEKAIHHHLKGVYTTERLEEATNVATQVTASKKNGKD